MMLNFNTSLLFFDIPGDVIRDQFSKEFNAKLQEKKIAVTQIIKLTVFYNHLDNYQISVIKEALIANLAITTAICFITQPPLTGGNLAVEITYSSDSHIQIVGKKQGYLQYTLVEAGTEQHIFISGAEGIDKNLTIREQAETAFNLVEQIFDLEEFTFTDIVRQWNYIEDITVLNDSKQNYQVFNDVRTKYYEKNGLVSDYPAATGIGIKTGGIIIDVHAIKPTLSLNRVEIANPKQIDAYRYSQEVLEGQPSEGYKQRTTPKFARAKAVINQQNASILVSGTASIEGELTIGINQVEQQTEVTIRNIDRLIKAESVKPFLPAGKWEVKFSQTRVYIKYPEHIQQVKAICEKYFTTGDTAYIESDICRRDLLVEIECVATLV